MITLLLQAVGVLYIFALPGILIALSMDTGWSLHVRLAVGTTLAMLAMPMLCFCVAWILARSVTLALVLGVATSVNAVAGALLWRRRRAGHA